jgi:hypothetical protein
MRLIELSIIHYSEWHFSIIRRMRIIVLEYNTLQ